MAGKTPAEVIRLNMEQAPNADEWLIAARAAAHDQTPSLMSALLAGAKKYPDQKAAIARLCFHHGSPAALSAATGWLKSRDATQRLYAALIAIRHGNEDERRAARAKLNDLMAGPWDESVLVGAVEPALSLRDPEATAALCKLLDRKELEDSWSFGAVAHHLFLSDHPAVLAALVKGLSSTANPKTETGTWLGKEVKTKHVRGDRMAQAVANMRKGYEYPSYAPAEDRAVARADLAAWLKQQAARRKAGQDTPELDTKPAAIRVAEWHIDAP